MRFLLAGVVACATLLPLPSTARPFLTRDVRRIVDIEQPAISPDGKTIAFVVIRSNFAKATYESELRIVDIADERETVITHGGDVAVPRWSPDGRSLAYLQRRDERLCLVVSSGGRTRVVARVPGDITDFAWRPDGNALAFSAGDPPPDRDYFEAGDNDYTQTTLTPPVHLWFVDAHGGTPRRLTSGTWTLAPTDPGGMFMPAFSWAHDGRSIVFVKVPTTFSGANENSTLQRIDVATGRIAKVTAHPSLELAPEFSPDGARLAYWYPQDGNFLAQNTVRVLAGDTDGAAIRNFDRDLGGTLWLPDSRTMLACGNDETVSRAYLIPVGGTPRILDLGGLQITCDAYQSSTFDAGIAASVARNGAIAFLATDPTHLRELYYLRAAGARPVRLTHFNDFVQHLDLGKIAPIAWDGPNGFREYGVLFYPPHMTPDKRYPLVVDVHGGPGLAMIQSLGDASYGGAWPIAELIAARGYVVFLPNYRGSDNAGNAFLTAIIGDTVAGPAADIMSGLAVVKTLPHVDANRVGISGWSYGGLMTSWLIGHYHDWKAAVSGAAVNVETESYDLSVSNVQDRYYQGGVSPYVGDGMKHYIASSPITYAASIVTPTLIWGTTRDPVVPVTMSYALYHALKDNHRTVRFVVFDAPTHGPNTPRNTEELTDLWIGWFDRYLK
ncbi:MAG: S9 family peptidase [Candidatus Eremiobacteraeota bacterium]|nr:S9 family peptidase [Candidatus Eremiobacteraeota bacterium]